MLKNVLIVSSATSEKDKTQTSLIYLATILNKLDIHFDLLDLSGTTDYFDPPQEFFSPCDSEYWLSPRIFHEASWLDYYLPNDLAEFDAVFYSALFSPDILIHGRHSINQKKRHPNCISIIGGAAMSCLNDEQLSVISEAFDHVCVGYDVENLISKVVNKYIEKIQPNYELVDIKQFLTVYSGHGCNWGKCRFCNSAKLSNCQYYSRPAIEIAHDFEKISQLNGRIDDVMLSSDSFTQENLVEVASCLDHKKLNIPYNIMLRGGKWVSEEIGELLRKSGCTDVFVGAEALNDKMLKIVNKGTNVEGTMNAIKNLSKSVKVIMGLMLFIPCVTERQLDEQLFAIEKILPYVNAIEPEILSVVYRSEFADHPEKYGIKLWATEKTINDSWCYGLSPDIPWTFCNSNDAEIWFKFYDRLKCLIDGFVQPHYWDSIDYMRDRYGGNNHAIWKNRET